MKQTTPTTAELRAWAHDHGIKVADRGRISSDVLDAWTAANAATVTATPSKTATRAKAPASARKPAALPARQPATPAASDPESESRASKADARFAALEQRVRDLEGRIDATAATKPITKRRFLRRAK
jgi:Lsr2